jgi:CRP-like cAMP-binding protein
VDFKRWYRESHGERTPWGDEESTALTAPAESELERALSSTLMADGGTIGRRRLAPGETLVEQGEAGDELYLVLDGVFDVEIDGAKVAELGPGAMAGERAVLEGGVRTATLRAASPARVAVIPKEAVERGDLELLSAERKA